MVDPFAARAQPLHHLDRAVDGRAFLVPGQHEGDRALEFARGDEAERRRQRGGDAALHIRGAAAP
jgi:hypothetical protein